MDDLKLEPRTQPSRCPYCLEVPGERALTCVQCGAEYHLGCVGEASERRCIACGSMVKPPSEGNEIARRWRQDPRRPATGWRAVVRGLMVLYAIAFSMYMIGWVYPAAHPAQAAFGWIALLMAGAILPLIVWFAVERRGRVVRPGEIRSRRWRDAPTDQEERRTPVKKQP